MIGSTTIPSKKVEVGSKKGSSGGYFLNFLITIDREYQQGKNLTISFIEKKTVRSQARLLQSIADTSAGQQNIVLQF